MPNFLDPFSGKSLGRKMSNEELIRAVRLDIAAENEAVHAYMSHAESTNSIAAKKVLIDIANEERVHIGELLKLLNILTKGDECEYVKKGMKEVKKVLYEGKRRSKK